MAEIASEEFTLPSKEDGFVGRNINQQNLVRIIEAGGTGWSAENIPVLQENLFDYDYTYSQSKCAYWNNSKDRYLIMIIDVAVDIWRVGTVSYNTGYMSELNIYKLDNKMNVIEDVTSKHTTDWRDTVLKKGKPNSYFVKFCSKLPPGIYKFSYGTGTRLEGSWLLEGINSFMIKQDSKYYYPIPETYNAETKLYEPIETGEYANYSVQTFDLFEDVIIGEETFKPIDKFDKFSIVTNWSTNISVKGTKSSSELIVANGDIDVSIAETIHSFALKCNQIDSIIKLAISKDGGKSWYTCSGSNLVPLDITIPLKNCSDMSQDEIQQYENAKQSILENGIDINLFNKQNFNTLFNGCKLVRFAYVMKLNDLGSTAELDSMQWNFDAKGSMMKMNDEEVQIDVYEHSLLATSLIDADIIKVNMII